MVNVALEFGLFKRISGEVEFYWKKGTDLLGTYPLDPTTGVFGTQGNAIMHANVANMRGQGIDLKLAGYVLKSKFNWNTNLIFSFNTNRVTKYFASSQDAPAYLNFDGGIVPIEGKPVSAIYSYRWAGLDPATGDPRGYINGSISNDYAALTAVKFNDLVYNGSSLPKKFGSIRNTFSYHDFSLSVNIIGKFGYYFRSNSIDYNKLYLNNTIHSDYLKRWQVPGDEVLTNVPSLEQLTSIDNPRRSQFYQRSEALVEKGDHIRLQDLQLNYHIAKKHYERLPFGSMQIYAYLNNLGILWRANKKGLDPDAGSLSIPDVRTVAFGLNFSL